MGWSLFLKGCLTAVNGLTGAALQSINHVNCGLFLVTDTKMYTEVNSLLFRNELECFSEIMNFISEEEIFLQNILMKLNCVMDFEKTKYLGEQKEQIEKISKEISEKTVLLVAETKIIESNAYTNDINILKKNLAEIDGPVDEESLTYKFVFQNLVSNISEISNGKSNPEYERQVKAFSNVVFAFPILCTLITRSLNKINLVLNTNNKFEISGSGSNFYNIMKSGREIVCQEVIKLFFLSKGLQKICELFGFQPQCPILSSETFEGLKNMGNLKTVTMTELWHPYAGFDSIPLRVMVKKDTDRISEADFDYVKRSEIATKEGKSSSMDAFKIITHFRLERFRKK